MIPDRDTERAGKFITDLSGAAPQPEGSGQINATTTSPVAFLFKIEEMVSHNISFIWTVSACQYTFKFQGSCMIEVKTLNLYIDIHWSYV